MAPLTAATRPPRKGPIFRHTKPAERSGLTSGGEVCTGCRGGTVAMVSMAVRRTAAPDNAAVAARLFFMMFVPRRGNWLPTQRLRLRQAICECRATTHPGLGAILMVSSVQGVRLDVHGVALQLRKTGKPRSMCCLLYTSDAADDLLCVDLGG